MKTGVHYVAGFMFSRDKSAVALIRKNKPAWQAGKLNGIGGKVEEGENIQDAMVREFREETGATTIASQWKHYCAMHGNNNSSAEKFKVDFFVTLDDVTRLKSPTPEKVQIMRTSVIHPLRNDMIENLPWLIALALDHWDDGRPGFVTATYP